MLTQPWALQNAVNGLCVMAARDALDNETRRIVPNLDVVVVVAVLSAWAALDVAGQ